MIATSSISVVSQARAVLFVIPDTPGYFAELSLEMARNLSHRGVRTHFLATHRMNARLLAEMRRLGDTHIFSWRTPTPSVLQRDLNFNSAEHRLHLWDLYPTFDRQKKIMGSPKIDLEVYRKYDLFVRAIFDTHPEIQLCWSELVSNATISITHRAATEGGVPFLSYSSAPVSKHFYVSTDVEGAHVVAPLPEYRSLVSRSTRMEVIHRPSLGGGVPDYMRQPFQRVPIGRQVQNFSRIVLYRDSLERRNAIWNTLFSVFRDRVLQPLRSMNTARVNASYSRGEGSLRLLVPLQYEPEASMSVSGFPGADFELLITYVAFSAPLGSEVLLKEHPNKVSFRSRREVRSLESYPGVKRLPFDSSLEDILDSGIDGVVTFSSRAGREAALRGIPTAVLGKVPWAHYRSVEAVGGFRHLKEWVEGLTAQKVGSDVPLCSLEAEKKVEREVLWPGSFDYRSVSNLCPENVELLVGPILQALERGVGPT